MATAALAADTLAKAVSPQKWRWNKDDTFYCPLEDNCWLEGVVQWSREDDQDALSLFACLHGRFGKTDSAWTDGEWKMGSMLVTSVTETRFVQLAGQISGTLFVGLVNNQIAGSLRRDLLKQIFAHAIAQDATARQYLLRYIACSRPNLQFSTT